MKERRPHGPFGPSMDALCHPCFTTTNLSYRFPIFEPSATALCGLTGIYFIYNVSIYLYISIYLFLYLSCIIYLLVRLHAKQFTRFHMQFSLSPPPYPCSFPRRTTLEQCPRPSGPSRTQPSPRHLPCSLI